MTLTADQASDIHHALGAASALAAAVDVGLLHHLAARPASVADVATDLRLDPRILTVLLAALARMGTVATDADGRSRVTEDPRVWDLIVENWRCLPKALRTGEPGVRTDRPEHAGPHYAALAHHLAVLTEPVARRTAPLLARPDIHVLDVGAGSGPWSRAILAVEPSSSATALDLPDVLAATRDAAAAAGVADRFTFLPGDVFTVELADQFDVVVAACVCRLFGDDANRSLARRLHDWVRPGGIVAVIDTLAHPDGAVALYVLGLALRTSSGAAHPFSSYATWLYDAGFERIERFELGPPELSLVRARRPA